MVHLAPVSDKVLAKNIAKVFVDVVLRRYGLVVGIVSDRDTRFTSKFWRTLFGRLGTKLSTSTAAHPETNIQTERVNRVLEDVLLTYASSFREWTQFFLLAEFASNNSTHASAGHSPFDMNYGIYPRVPASIMGKAFTFSGEGRATVGPKCCHRVKASFDLMRPLDDMTTRDEQRVDDFIAMRQAIVRFVPDAIAKAQKLQEEQADRSGRKNEKAYKVHDLVLISTTNLPEHALSNLGSMTLLTRFIGPSKVMICIGNAYTSAIPTRMRLHPTFYVARLKSYLPNGYADFALSNLGSMTLLTRFIGQSKVMICIGNAYTSAIPTRMRLHPTFYVARLKSYLPNGYADFTLILVDDRADH